ncbi:MAG: hypothetical protein ACR2GT_11940 [Gaiellaceae bacterium]
MTLLRLALATAVVLAPGWAVARALGIHSVSATLAWALAVLFGALAVTFLVGGSLGLTLVLLLAIAVVALAAGRRAARGESVPGRWWIFGAGAVLGLLLWPVAGEIGGDGLFHLARARKLDAFDELSLDSVNEFADGGLHPGYAFPLWHGFLALVARIAFLDPADVVLHEASILAPIALLVSYEAGWALFRRVGPAVAVVAAQVGITALAPDGGGAYTALGLPATASRQLLVPAALALGIAAAARPTRGLLASTAAAGLALAVVHPTYALFLWLPFAGFLVVRSLVAWREAKPIAAALAALVVPAGLYLAWLAPIVRETRSVSPTADELGRALRQYEEQLDVYADASYRLAPEVFGRSGAIAVAALLCVPLAGFALRRRWAAYVLGGALSVLAVMLVPTLFVSFSDAVSLSQSRRVAGFLPFAFAFGGGLAVLAGLLRFGLLPIALAAGIALQLVSPGDFGYRLESGGPALATWIAAGGGVLALVVGLVLEQHKRARRRRNPAPGARKTEPCVGTTQGASALVAIAAALFVLPVAFHAAANWSPSDARRPSPLTAGLVVALREEVPQGAVVYSDLETSYRIAAEAPVYIAAASPAHVADTGDNRPYERRDANRRFFRTGDLGIPRAAGAGWLVVDRERFELTPRLSVVHRDERFTLFRL